MRILHVSHYLPTSSSGGVENYTVSLAGLQVERGHTVSVYARGTRLDVEKGWEENVSDKFDSGFAATEAHSGKSALYAHQRVRWDMNAQFGKFVDAFQPDVVHFQHLMYHSTDYPRIARQSGAATVFTLHDLWPTCPIVKRVDFRGDLCQRPAGLVCAPCLWNAKRANIVPREAIARVAHSNGRKLLHLWPTADELSDWLPGTRRWVREIDLLISPSRFYANMLQQMSVHPVNVVVTDCGVSRPVVIEEAVQVLSMPVRFGVIGSDKLKGVAVALDAFRQTGADINAELVIWGDTSAGDLPPGVSVQGRFGQEEIEKVYRSFDVLIAPSLWWENAMLVIREAFARKKPVIASDMAGMTESIRDGEDGFLFPTGDADALAAIVRRIAQEPDLLPALRAQIRPPKFLDEHAEEMDELYVRALNNAHGAR